jgi:hypothetical protein
LATARSRRNYRQNDSFLSRVGAKPHSDWFLQLFEKHFGRVYAGVDVRPARS